MDPALTETAQRPAAGHIPPLSTANNNQPLSEEEQAKVRQITDASDSCNYLALRGLAASTGGLINDEVRRLVCTSMHAFCHSQSRKMLTITQGQLSWARRRSVQNQRPIGKSYLVIAKSPKSN